MKVIAIDLDNTILHYKKGWLGENVFGKPIVGAKIGLKKIRKLGCWIIIYTCRGNRERIGLILKKYGILKGVHYDAINQRKYILKNSYRGKLGADIYIDDRGLMFTGNWKKTVKQVKNFKIWNEKKCQLLNQRI